jgi:thiosulfate/3-mercaptopyruvate sulfurtransferase
MAFTTLVGTQELRTHLDDPRWLVFDCTHDIMNSAAGATAYAKGHIPGAAFLAMDHDLAAPKNGSNGRHPLPSPAAFAERLGQAGFDGTQQVVAYDAQGGMPASRLWWMLRWLGHDAVAVLDGGFVAWSREGLPVSQSTPSRTPKVFTARIRHDAMVNADQLLADRHHTQYQVVDARAADRYRGENEMVDPVAGHIPGALNRFWGLNLAPDGKFKAGATLAAEFKSLLGNRAASAIVNSCGSGVSACHNLLAMEIAGLSGARLYPGSWSEWIADESRPIATGPQP